MTGGLCTTAVRARVGQASLDELQGAGVQITADTSGISFGAEVLSWLTLLPAVVVIG